MHAIGIEYRFLIKKVMTMMRVLAIFMPFFYFSLSAMEFIDSKGHMCKLPVRESLVFCTSDLGKQFADDIRVGNEIDFSSLKRAGLKGANILKVLTHVHDPSYLTPTNEVVPEEVEMLEAAHYLGLEQQKCARHFAARLWPVIQKNGPNPLKLSDWQKGYVCAMARPHMACPAHFLEHLKGRESIGNDARALVGFREQYDCFDLSHEACKNVGYLSRFVTLQGIKEFAMYIAARTTWTQSRKVILDGHALDSCAFSLQDIMQLGYRMTDISLNGNCIEQVPDEVFQSINRLRASSFGEFNFKLSLKDNPLSVTQKNEIQKNFYKATHTIPERWAMGKTTIYKPFLIIIPFALWVMYVKYTFEHIREYEREYCIGANKQKTIAIQIWVSLFAVAGWTVYMSTQRFNAHLARLSHPRMDLDSSNDWYLDEKIWPKNNAILLL